MQTFSLYHLLTSTYSRVSNRRGGWNKRGGWQILSKIINGEGAINGGWQKISKVNKRGGWNVFMATPSLQEMSSPYLKNSTFNVKSVNNFF